MNSKDYITFLQPLQTELMRLSLHRWADLGCGSGVFTAALATLLSKNGLIFAVDKSKQPLLPVQGNGVAVQFIQADFEQNMPELYPLDGIMMANSLHFVKDKAAFLKNALSLFGSSAYFIIAEYESEVANTWVPYPISFKSLTLLFRLFGFKTIEKVNSRASKYGGEMYLAKISKN